MNNTIIKQLKNLWALPTRKGVFFAVLLLAMGTSTLLCLATTHNEQSLTQEPATDTLVVSRLNELQSQLKTLGETVNKPLPEVNLNAITQQIALLSKRLEQLRENDSKQLTETLTQSQNTLGQELHSIKEVVTHLDDKKSSVKYLPLKSLPFSIVSIDSIQQVPVASVSYDYKTIPLEKGDALAGWKVVSVDYSKQRLELENAQSERVLVTHEHVG
jgi:hypothetical protein